ncbi:MAG: ABC transporter permease subunit [Candidatus Kapabacteria bacterium]|nr:ABC transporter permease subunit [Candidatus Kapabacteria bacterium]
MLEYFIRRLLLTIPTFIGCTIVVYAIVSTAPGGPLDMQLQALKRGSGGETGTASNVQGQNIPPEAVEELKRFYNFDKPIPVQYMMWLGIMKRDAESFTLKPDEPRLVGNGIRIKAVAGNGGYTIVDADNPSQVLSDWLWETKKMPSGEMKVRIFRQEYSGILNGNFGTSYTYRKPVMELVQSRIPISTQFGIISLVLSYIVCVYLGIQKALRHNSTFDFASSTIVFIAYSVPGWALGAVLLVFFSTESFLPLFPLGGFEDKMYSEFSFIDKVIDRASHFVLPLIAYMIGGFATLTMLMKNSLLDNLSQDYIRTAFAKGIREQRVIWLHAMRNSIIPIAANMGYLIGVFLTGSYLIESVFGIDGIGKLSFEAVVARDYPIVFCFTVISVSVTLVGSILSDLILSLVDPRIRFK